MKLNTESRKVYVDFSAELHFKYWAEIRLCSQTALLCPIESRSSPELKINPQDSSSYIEDCICQVTLPKGGAVTMTGQSSALGSLYTTTKESQFVGNFLMK